MYNEIQQKQDDGKEKLGTKWKRRFSSLWSCLVTDQQLRNENEELKKRNKEHELLQRYRPCTGEEHGIERSQAYQVHNNDEEIPRATTSHSLKTLQSYQVCYDAKEIPRATTSHSLKTLQGRNDNDEISTHITVIKATSSPFQRNLVRRKDVDVIRKERPKSYPYSVGDHNVVGFQNDADKLVQELTDKESDNFLAIVGIGGSGKTTLARKIFNHEKFGSHFHYKAWICISQVWKKESVLKDILSQTTERKNIDILTVQETERELHKLLGNKSYFIVLDDVWEQDALREIMSPIPISHSGKFVITTRNQGIGEFSDLNFLKHEIRRLTMEESWELFKKIAFGHQRNAFMAHNNDRFDNLAKEMLQKCDGLPLAIVTLAGLLRTKETIQDWKEVRDNVSSKINADKKGPFDYGRVDDMLGLSFSYLDRSLKSCFMYLGLFPEDAEISSGMLMRCWIAEGFFKSIRLVENERIEDVAMECLDELIQRCLVQVVRVNYAGIAGGIRVHDLLRDLAIKKAKKMYFFDTIDSGPGASGPPSMQTLRLGDGDRSKDLQIKVIDQWKGSLQLRSFVWLQNSFLSVNLKRLFSSYPFLRVLILHDLDVTPIPDEIGNLIHLRCFRLLSHFLHNLPKAMENLRNLLILDYRITDFDYPGYVVKVPNLKEMKHLIYLHLPGMMLHHKSVLNLQKLENLKVLWGIGSGQWMIMELPSLSPTVDKLEIIGIQDFKQLEMVYQCPSIVKDCLYTLKLDWGYVPEFQVKKLLHCEKLQNLELKGEISKDVPLIFPPNLLKLVLTWIRIRDGDSFADALKKLPFLKILHLLTNAYYDSHLIFPSHSLVRLEQLCIRSCMSLKEIRVMEGGVTNIKHFYIGGCRSLRVVPQCLKSVQSILKPSWEEPQYFDDE